MSSPFRTDASAPVLAVNGITVSFPAGSDGSTPAPKHRREVVHGVGFDLVPGRVLALVGESGSGKSVTAMSILDLLPPSARFTGSVRLEGQELVGAGPDQLRAVRGGRIGTIFQEPMSALNPVFTVGNQIAEGLRQHNHNLSRDEADRRVLELLESVEVRDPERVARSYPHELSGGQLQRAMIAMAIGNEPVVLIADEPTTALDVTVQAGILGLLRDLKDRLGTAVLLITHDMGVVADLADDVVVMREGRVVETADVGTLFASPRDDYTKTLLAAVPRLAALQISERALDPGRSGSAADGTARDTPATDGTGTGARSTATPAAQLNGASVIYRGRGLGAGLRAVDRVSLTIAPGEVLGLVGESGSGKSTIGRALAGLVPVSEGQAQLAGIDIARVSRRALRRARTELGIVFQDPASSLNPRHTIGHSISEPIRLHRRMPEQAVRARVRELLDAVQLGAALEERLPHELSGGQRQRVAIARAISLEPALLIADEPTSALDVSVQARILDLVRELQADLRFACLFISHDLAVVGEVTSRVAVMHRGVVVEEGRTGEVLTRPRDPYTQRLLAAAPVADPAEQRQRREAWQELMAG